MEATIYNYTTWLEIVEPKILVPLLEDMLRQVGFTVLSFTEHHFEPQGYTAVWILAESHLAIHTFPERGKTYVELSSCNEVKNRCFMELEESLVVRKK